MQLILGQVPTMPAINLPIDGASVVTAVVAIGVTVLLLYAGPKIGFLVAKRLMGKLSSAVGGGQSEWADSDYDRWDQAQYMKTLRAEGWTNAEIRAGRRDTTF